MDRAVPTTWQTIENMVWGQFTADGGPGSGNFGHAGRPGEVGGSASGEGPGRISVKAGQYKRLKQTLKNCEAELRQRKTEKGVVYDDDGNAICHRCGTKDEIKWKREEILKMKDGSMTHNHPNDSTFSVNDVLFAVGNGLKRIRACTSWGAFELTRAYKIGDNVPGYFSLFGQVYAANDAAWRDYLTTKAAKEYNGKNFKKIQKDFAVEYDRLARDWFKESAANFGWSYKEETL